MNAGTAIAFDGVYALLLLVIVGVPLAAVTWFASRLPLPLWAIAGLTPLLAIAFLAGMIITAGLVLALVPRLKPGSYSFPKHSQSLSWLARFAVQRVLNLPLWAPLIYSFALLRWLALRAQGGDVALGIQTSSDVSLTDPSLTRVEAGSMLAAGTFLAAHFIEHDQLLLAPVHIGKGVQLMGEVMVAPGVSIGEGTVVGPGTKLLPQVQLGVEVYVGMGCILYNGARVGNNAVIGHQTTLEAEVSVGEGATVQSGVRIPKGTIIGDGETYPPRVRGGVA